MNKNFKNLKKENSDLTNKIPPIWFFLDTETHAGEFNMACDNFLLTSLLKNSIKFPVLRVYSWTEKIFSIGANQKFQTDLSGYKTVKRITGGQAVLHGTPRNELTYSVVMQDGLKVKSFYLLIGKVLIAFLEKYSLTADFGN